MNFKEDPKVLIKIQIQIAPTSQIYPNINIHEHDEFQSKIIIDSLLVVIMNEIEI